MAVNKDRELMDLFNDNRDEHDHRDSESAFYLFNNDFSNGLATCTKCQQEAAQRLQ